jgi:YD repeat-containing protein
MKRVNLLLIILSIAGAGFFLRSHAAVPNYVQNEVHVNPDSAPSISISYADGMGRNLQTSLLLDVNKARVIATMYDSIGRPWKNTVPMVYSMPPVMDFLSDPVNDAGYLDYPYHESRYKPDPLNRPDSSGAPTHDFSLAQTHFSRIWNLETKITGTAQTNVDRYGFIPERNLDNASLDLLEANGVISDPDCFLTVAKGPNDNSYVQVIKDKFGRTVSSCSMLGMRAEFNYDIVGNVLQETPPDSSRNSPRIVDADKATSYRFSSAGQLIYKSTPDAGIAEFKYDAAGQLIAVQNAKQRQTAGGCDYTVYLYDSIGRNYAVGVNSTTTRFDDANFENIQWDLSKIDLRILRIYDDPANLAAVLGAAYTPAFFAANFCPLEKTHGRLVAEIAYQSVPAVVDPTAARFFDNVTVDILYYDGPNIIAKLKRVPGLRNFCMFTYSYDQQDNVVAYRYAKNDNGVDPTMDNLQYHTDRHGRLMTVNSTDPSNVTNALVDYHYNDEGLLRRKYFGFSADHSTYVDRISYNYTVWNTWLQSIGCNRFSEDLAYNEPTPFVSTVTFPQWNGNISAAVFRYSIASSSEYEDNQYKYDLVNRLENVYPTTYNFSTFDDISYNNDGTIDFKSRMGGTAGTPQFNGRLRYIPHTNKVHKVENHPTKNSDNNFIYDPNGNMVLDYSKKMYIEYNWRDMPVCFTFYNSIPASVLVAADETARANLWQNLKQAIEATATVVSEVKMVYDASGNRVRKKEFKYQ